MSPNPIRSILEEVFKNKLNGIIAIAEIIVSEIISRKCENIHLTLWNAEFSGFSGFDSRMLKL
jgi:hypothetical protein